MKKYLHIAGVTAFAFLFAVSGAHAQTGGSGSLNLAPLQNLGGSLIVLLNTVLVPVVFAFAFIAFLWGVFQYFILGATQPEKRQEGTQFVMWSIIGLVVMISIWGIVNLVGNTLPLGSYNRPDLPTFENSTGQTNSPNAASSNNNQINESKNFKSLNQRDEMGNTQLTPPPTN
jgi:hypothetical protein